VRTAALFSGGKDSTYAIYLAQQSGLSPSCLVSAIPTKDSWMFHVPNLHLTPLLSKLMGIPLVRIPTGTKRRELADLTNGLRPLPVDGLIHGAIASDYQKSRIDLMCEELGWRGFAPLWQKNPEKMWREFLNAGFRAIVVGVAAEGLDAPWLGREIDDQAIDDLIALRERYGIHLSGEGGEYETLVIDGPNFLRPLIVRSWEKSWDGMRGSLKIRAR